MATVDFDDFINQNPAYRAAYQKLEEESRLLTFAAATVYAMNGDALGPESGDILRYVNAHFPPNYIAQYIARVEELQALDKRFKKNPSAATLGDPTLVVDRRVYDLGLLLSIVFTNHRFEIIQQLRRFLAELPQKTGRIASIGAGPGYEIKLIADALPGWTIEGYDTNLAAHQEAAKLLAFFGVGQAVEFKELFPLDAPAPDLRGRYDAIVLCEILEHLPDPATALATARECLCEGGRVFATMAINIAQEDHIFLYPDIESCRRQIAESGFKRVSEWITPQTVFAIGADRASGFSKGNYVAILEA